MTDQIASLIELLTPAADPNTHPEEIRQKALAARIIAEIMLDQARSPGIRRTIEKLMIDVAAARPMINRTYRHHATGDLYSLLFVAFDEKTNETQAVFGLCALPALKFTCPLDKFRDSFEEDHGTQIAK